jgi:hypothetical protein
VEAWQSGSVSKGGSAVKRWQALLALILGAALIVFGINSISETTVDCGGQTMQAGDTCVTYGSGGSVTRSVSQQLSQDRGEGWIAAGFGTFMLLGGGIFFFAKRE